MKPERDSLVAGLLAGEHSAAEELVDRYYEGIYLYMRRLGHSVQVSEDLTQESFLAAWRHIGELRTGRALNSWLYRIAGNASRLYWRRHKGASVVSFEEFDWTQGDKADCGAEVEHLEQLGQLRKAVGQLPIKLKQAVVLHYMQHLTIAEAAEASGVREGTFKSRLSRALRALREQVK